MVKEVKKSSIKGAKKSKKLIPKTTNSKVSKKNVPQKIRKPKLTKTDISKRAMLVALEKSLGIVTTACKQVDIARQTHYEWMQEDENYRIAVEAVAELVIDFVESKFQQQIAKGDTTACIFYLKTKAKKRGYIERTEIDHSIRKDTDLPTLGWVSTEKKE